MASSPASLCYPRAARLVRPEDFTALRDSGQRLSLRYFQCQYRMTDAPCARLGQAVSRRVSKRAVVRNRIRRQIRESFRLHRANLPVCDVLIIARTLAATQDNRSLREELEKLWSRLGALRPALNEAELTGTMRGS